jgi:gliding motility-associated-like protein
MSNGSATANPGGGQAPYTYLWLTTPAQLTPTATGLPVGTQTLIVVDAKGCSQQFIVAIPGASAPIADFTYNPNSPIPFLNPNVGFNDLSVNHPVYWQWNFGDPNSGPNDSSYIQNPSHVFSDTGYYCITLIIMDSSKVCRDTIVKCLRVEADFTFYIPNCFTPNGDDINDMFFGKGTYIKHFNMWIYDRWGNLIWKCETSGNPQDSQNCKWSGTVTDRGADLNGSSGKLIQEDVYVWKVDLTDIHDKEHHYVGHLSKVR